MARKKSAARAERLSVRDLEPSDWPVLERLFGPRGACGGCWCMAWRVPGGKAWEAAQGAPNKRAFRALVRSGRARGCLAFAGEEPVGWCSVGPKADFLKLSTSRVLATPRREGTWAVTCFYVPARWRGRGVASALLAAAVDQARRAGARALEGYPAKPASTRAAMPAAFAWTGVPALFEAAGFRRADDAPGARPIYLRRFRARRA